MGRSLSVRTGIALASYNEYEGTDFFEEMFEDLDNATEDFDEWVFECFRVQLGLPELPEWCPREFPEYDSRRSYQEWRQRRKDIIRDWESTPEGTLYRDIQRKVREARAASNVDMDFYGVLDYTSTILYHKPSLGSEGGYGCANIKPLTEEQEQEAREALLSFAKIVKLTDYYEKIGRDINLDIKHMAWASYY